MSDAGAIDAEAVERPNLGLVVSLQATRVPLLELKLRPTDTCYTGSERRRRRTGDKSIGGINLDHSHNEGQPPQTRGPN